MFACDLHTHTTRSDGHLNPLESIDRASEIGIKVLAITDHDIILPLYYEAANGSINLEEYAAGKGVELLRGIEISCDTHNEDVHIIGLFCDWTAPEFYELERRVQDSRLSSYQEIMKRLEKGGYDVSWEEFLKDAGRENYPERVHKKQIYEYLAGKGYADTWKEGKKLIQSNPEYNLERNKPEPVETIRMLHRAGGLAILAHPFLIKDEPFYHMEKITRFAYMDLLIREGLDGIEASYTYDKTSYDGALSKDQIEQIIRERYKNSGIFFSGGSDFHGDYKRKITNPRELGECGITYGDYIKYIKRRQ